VYRVGEADDPALRGVIAIGASAGGIDALQRFMRALPDDLAAAVLVVLHIPASSRSVLADIIARQTVLPVRPAVHGQPLRAGTVSVAPPDRHLTVQGDRLHLTRGPKENGVRPAIDPMFRSLAGSHGARAVAIVLSGSLSDGAAGAAAIAAAGGAVLVQSPEDALVPSMPEAALAAAPRARAFEAAALAEAAARLIAALPPRDDAPADGGDPEEVPMTDDPLSPLERSRDVPEGPPAGLTCPECHGPLWEVRDGQLSRYRCRVGHVYGEDALLDGKGTAVESALWIALESLEERVELLEKVAGRLLANGRERSARSMRERARGAAQHAELIRGVLAIGEAPVEVEHP
jgi:two-component system, chemotaxis family, protein-glutamate methylesterase/glutaminase